MRFLRVTPVAAFEDETRSPIGSVNFAHQDLKVAFHDAAQKNPDHYVAIYSDEGELVFENGPKGLIPAIWTHKPLPSKFPIEKVRDRFEKRAVDVLGDWDSPLNFDKWQIPGMPSTHNDNRYRDPTLRAAWMMYIDQTVVEFKAHGHVCGVL